MYAAKAHNCNKRRVGVSHTNDRKTIKTLIEEKEHKEHTRRVVKKPQLQTPSYHHPIRQQEGVVES